ncbi:Hypothetical predicted protein [Paramuricea clavata]|uniref:Uncharacterized protein n=1 Tax=Paramuricea clavata TaxID=317549 RepID=A0A6S7G419_PARCT|nr:Hypothetical predicted protein [Paramuricea clavata]
MSRVHIPGIICTDACAVSANGDLAFLRRSILCEANDKAALRLTYSNLKI